MALPLPPAAPQRGDSATFSSRVDAFLLWLVGVIPALNTFISSITTLAAGGANSFSYTFDSSIADSDPGTGRLRLGSVTQNGAVVMRIDTTAGNGGDITAFLASLAAGTSNVKGSVRLQRVNDVSAWLLFDVTSVDSSAGYRNLTLTPRASSTASPFANNDTLMVFFSKQGDRGTSGGTPTQAEIIAAVGTLGIANGGTGATTADQALISLGAKKEGTIEPISEGGTGAATAAQARANLGAAASFNASFTGTTKFDATGIADVAMDIYGTGPAGVQIALWGNGSTPNKRIRLINGVFDMLNNAGAGILSLTDAGVLSAPVITQTSDERKKTNWRALTDEQLDAFAAMSLAGVFDWVDGGSSAGGSAQQIRDIVPEVVHENAHGELSVDYGGLNFAIIQAELRRLRGQA